MTEKISARPTAMTTNRATSMKIVGIRLRQFPSGAPWKSVAFTPDSSQHQHDEAEAACATIRTGVAWAAPRLALISSSSSAPSGSR